MAPVSHVGESSPLSVLSSGPPEVFSIHDLSGSSFTSSFRMPRESSFQIAQEIECVRGKAFPDRHRESQWQQVQAHVAIGGKTYDAPATMPPQKATGSFMLAFRSGSGMLSSTPLPLPPSTAIVLTETRDVLAGRRAGHTCCLTGFVLASGISAASESGRIARCTFRVC